MALLILTIPPGIFYAKRLVHDFQLAERWRRLVARAEKEVKATGARILIDLGDGNHIPLEQAKPEKIREALDALEKHTKS